MISRPKPSTADNAEAAMTMTVEPATERRLTGAGTARTAALMRVAAVDRGPSIAASRRRTRIRDKKECRQKHDPIQIVYSRNSGLGDVREQGVDHNQKRPDTEQ